MLHPFVTCLFGSQLAQSWLRGLIMYKGLWRSALLLCGLFFSSLLLSATTVAASNNDNAAPLNIVDNKQDFQRPTIEYLQDSSSELTIEDVRSNEDLVWTETKQEYVDFGIGADAAWYRLSFKNDSNQAVNTLLETSYPLLDLIDFYRFEDGELIEVVNTGDRRPFSQRIINHPHFLFPVHLEAHKQQTLYFRVRTEGAHIVALKAWQPEVLFERFGLETTFQGLYFGICATVVFFYFLIFIWLRESMYVYYSLSVLFVMLYFAYFKGYMQPFIFPESPDLQHWLGIPGGVWSGLTGALFTRQFMQLKAHSKGLDYLALSNVVVLVIATFAVFAMTPSDWLLFAAMCGTYTSSVFLILGPLAIYKRCPNAWVYTFGTGIMMSAWILVVLSRQGIIPVSFMTEYGGQFGSLVEVIVLTIALSYRVHKEHKDKVAAQSAQLEESAERIKVETELLNRSMTHPVTLMPNRTSFEQHIQSTILNRNNQRIAVVILEIERYNEINKTLGHQNTDLLLRELAQHYNQLLSKNDGVLELAGPSFNAHVCSLENASFGVLLDAQALEENRDDALKLIEALRKPIEFKGMEMELNTIAGIAVCPEHGLNAATLLRHAGVAADASEAIKNGFAYFKPEQDQYNTRRLTMISELKHAIEDDSLELFLQPKYDPRIGKVVGAEALIRWHHKLYGVIRPDEFIPMAEKTGIIKPLTRWVFRQALVQQKALLHKGYDLNISINLSAANLHEDDLIDFLSAELKVQGSDPARIYMELTETAMMADPKAAIAKLEEIRDLGLKVSIDDFGAGYSSLAYLKTLPANEIKIDRALVMELDTDSNEDTVIQSTTEMCHKLGFTVVAEGVETVQMLNTLTDLQCDLIQGYLLTPPLPQAQFETWMANNIGNRFVS